MSGPWTFGEASANCRDASRNQKAAEDAYREGAKKAARAEEAFRKELAAEIVRAHASGAAWTVAPDLARGNEKVARLRRERDIADGVREALLQACWRRTADRKDAQRFADWSQRRELAEGYGGLPEPEFGRPIGAR